MVAVSGSSEEGYFVDGFVVVMVFVVVVVVIVGLVVVVSLAVTVDDTSLEAWLMVAVPVDAGAADDKSVGTGLIIDDTSLETWLIVEELLVVRLKAVVLSDFAVPRDV